MLLATLSPSEVVPAETYFQAFKQKATRFTVTEGSIGCAQASIAAVPGALNGVPFISCRSTFSLREDYAALLAELPLDKVTYKSRIPTPGSAHLQGNELAKKLSILQMPELMRKIPQIPPNGVDSIKAILKANIQWSADYATARSYIDTHRESHIMKGVSYASVQEDQILPLAKIAAYVGPKVVDNLHMYSSMPFNTGMRIRNEDVGPQLLEKMKATEFTGLFSHTFSVDYTRIIMFLSALSMLSIAWKDKGESVKRILADWVKFCGLKAMLISPLIQGARAYAMMHSFWNDAEYDILPFDAKKFDTVSLHILQGVNLVAAAKTLASGVAFTSLFNTMASIYIAADLEKKGIPAKAFAILGDDVAIVCSKASGITKGTVNAILPEEVFEHQDGDKEHGYYLGFAMIGEQPKLCGLRVTRENADAVHGHRFHTEGSKADDERDVAPLAIPEFDENTRQNWYSMYRGQLADGTKLLDVFNKADFNLKYWAPHTMVEAVADLSE